MTMGFIGDYIRNLDEKGRVIIPPDFIRCMETQETIIFHISKEGDVELYPEEVFSDKCANLSKLTKEEKINFFENSQRLKIDSQHRINIPKIILAALKIPLNSELKLLGMYDNILIIKK